MAEHQYVTGDHTLEPKVRAASSAGGLAAAAAGVVVWLLGEYVFGGGTPEPVHVFVAAAVPAALAGLAALWAGWRARHQVRRSIEEGPL